jgi:hypothetical protein
MQSDVFSIEVYGLRVASAAALRYRSGYTAALCAWPRI